MKPLEIPYKFLPDAIGQQKPVAVLNVQVALPIPMAPRTKRFEAIIDSGATRCLFHSDIASHLGIDLSKCPVEQTQGIGAIEDTYLHDVTLYIPGGPVTATVGFKHGLPVAGLLGMVGFFEHFRVTFDPAGCCILERLYHA